MRDTTLHPTPRPGSVGPYTRIANAKSTSACAAAQVVSGNLRCKKFTAELLDGVSVDASTEDLTPTGVSVDVWNNVRAAMAIGEYLLIGQRSDGRWNIIVWSCP